MNKKSVGKQERKSFSKWALAIRQHNRSAFSRKEIKKSFSSENTQKKINFFKKMIKDKQTREQTIAFMRSADGKKIRNTSGV